MDAGCEFWGYASDVTRTWPVGGRYTPEQRRVYNLVARVRERCVLCGVCAFTVRPGACSVGLAALASSVECVQTRHVSGGKFFAHPCRPHFTPRLCHNRCLAEVAPGSTLAKVHQLSVTLLSEALAELGIMPGADADDFARGMYRCARGWVWW
jgi:hypothetical protein